jgi:hypothetical protein
VVRADTGKFERISPPAQNRLPKETPCQDIFGLDFQPEHTNVLFAGGRPGYLFLADTRIGHEFWSRIPYRAMITHVKALNQHQVLVSGLKDKMRVYDIRMMKRSNGNLHSPKHAAWREEREYTVTPFVTFPDYQNTAHIHMGLDVDIASGVVAAAKNDGTVALYSTKFGHKLKSPDIDKLRSSAGPIQALQFATMGRDQNASLFVGVHSQLQMYSFGPRDLLDEA